MSRKRIDNDIEEIQYDACMRLIEAILRHVLDNISITPKWNNKKIGIKTLNTKKQKLYELGKWTKTWQWDVWLNIFSEYYHKDNKRIKRKFELIRKKSIKEVNKRLKEYEKEKS